MNNIKIFDTTLCKEKNSYSFKEKIEIARQLERLNVDVIELPEIEKTSTDILLIKTLSAFVKNSQISVAAGKTEKSVDDVLTAISAFENACIRIELPISPVGMEYTCHKKPDKMLVWLKYVIEKAIDGNAQVEFCAVDATRAEKEFLYECCKIAVESGVSRITICDSACSVLPDDFGKFINEMTEEINIPIGIKCSNKTGLAASQSVLSIRNGASFVKCSVNDDTTALDTFGMIIKTYGNDYGIASNLKLTELHRTVKQIERITDNTKNNKFSLTSTGEQTDIKLDSNDSKEDIAAAVNKLGYDLSDDDIDNVYTEFLRVASKKNVGAKELDAIVASSAMQVPSSYKLISYVINNGNIITASAHIALEKDGKTIENIQLGDGPIDAAFNTIDKIIGHHYELDDFQIQAVTEGKEAMGSALVKLRSNGKLYSGNGISTDIIGASIRAYLNAINKIIYEEAEE